MDPDYVMNLGMASSLNLGHLVQLQSFVKTALERKWYVCHDGARLRQIVTEM